MLVPHNNKEGEIMFKKFIISLMGMFCFLGPAQEVEETLVQIGEGQYITQESYRIFKTGFVQAGVNIYGEAYDETDANTILRSQMRKNLAVAAFNTPDRVLKNKIESVVMQAGLLIVDNELKQPGGDAITPGSMINVFGGLWDLMSGYVKKY